MDRNIKSNRDRETVDAKESFDFRKESTGARDNEFFVYHHDTNNHISGTENNTRNTGKEVNTDVSKATEFKADDSLNKVTKMSNAVATTVQTAVVATSTVVVAVGGGAVIAGDYLDDIKDLFTPEPYIVEVVHPEICQFEHLQAYTDVIEFSIAVGHNLDDIREGKENEECNLVLELTLETSVVDSFTIANYGLVEGSFSNNISPSITYTLNLYQIVHKSQRDLLLTRDVQTMSSYVAISNMTFERVIDEDQDIYHYVTLEYSDPENYYSNLSLEFINTSTDVSIGNAALSAPYGGRQQIIMPPDFDDFSIYHIKVHCLSTDPRHGYTDELTGPVSAIIYEMDVAFDDIDEDVAPVAEKDVTFDREVDGFGNEHYYVTLTVDDTHNYYSNYVIKTIDVDTGDVISSNNINEPHSDRQEIIMPSDFIGEATYRIDVVCDSTNPKHQPQGKHDFYAEGENSVTIVLFSKEIDFSNIEETVADPFEHAISFYGVTNSYKETTYYADFSYNDEIEFDYASFELYDNDELVGYELSLETEFNSTATTELDLPINDLNPNITYEVRVYYVTEDPTGSSQEDEKTLWFTSTLKLSAVPTSNITYADPTIVFEKHITADYQTQYLATLTVDDDPDGLFYAYYLEFDDGIEDPFQIMLSTPYFDRQQLNDTYGHIDEEKTYTVKGYRTLGRGNEAVTSEFTDQLTTPITVCFGDLTASEETITNNAFFYKHIRANGNVEVSIMLTSPNEEYYSNFNITLYDASTQEELCYGFVEALFREKQRLDIDYTFEGTEELEILIQCESSNPSDDNGTGTQGNNGVVIDFFHDTVDFNEIMPTYEEYVAPSYYGLEISRYKTYYGNSNGMFMNLDIDDPNGWWTNYVMTFYADASHEEYLTELYIYYPDQPVRLDDDQVLNRYYSLADVTTLYYSFTCLSYDPNEPYMSDDGVEVTLEGNGTMDFDKNDEVFSSVRPYLVFTKTQSGTDGSGNPLYDIAVSLYFDDKDQYENYTITFELASMAYQDTFTQDCGSFKNAVDIDYPTRLDNSRIVTLTATNKLTEEVETLYSETLDFSGSTAV